MIQIVDVSDDPTTDQEHLCELHFNDHVVLTFSHSGDAGLKDVLTFARDAVIKRNVLLGAGKLTEASR